MTLPGDGAVVATDEVGGRHFQIAKLAYGDDGTATQVSETNPLPVESLAADLVSYDFSQAGVIAINTVLLNIDCSRLREVGIQCSAMGTTGVVTPEWSNNGTTWVGAALVTPVGATALTFNAAGLWRAPVFARFLRLRLSTATTAGTTTLALVGFAQGAGVMPSQAVTGTVTSSLSAGSTAIGDVGVQYRASATGGASVASVLSPATPAATSVKASAGRLLGWQLVNTSAAVRSVKLWNTAVGSITLGTTAALWEIDIPAGGTREMTLAGGIGFATAISYAVTGAKGLTDNTGTLGANDVSGSFFYA